MKLLAALITRTEPTTPTIGAETVTFAALGVATAGWLVSFAKGRLKQDAAEKLELAAAVKRSDAALDQLGTVVAELQVSVAKCETHREHDGREMARLRTELDAVKAKQNARLAGGDST